ncbi:MAG: hypothetical protein EOM50_23670, partial [Erysipelotrichia bacterium]|nr:hypothetical protein [Erysipelotrichia bacterium]
MIIIRDMVEKDYERKGYIHFRSWLESYDRLLDSRYLEKHSLEHCINIAKKYPENTLVAEYKNEIVKHLKELGHENVHFINGEIDTDTRNALKAMAEKDTGLVVVASYGVFSTGISVKNLHHVIFAHPVKSKVTVLQSIGRVLRKHDSKSLAQVWDVVDDLGVVPKSANSKKKYVH